MVLSASRCILGDPGAVSRDGTRIGTGVKLSTSPDSRPFSTDASFLVEHAGNANAVIHRSQKVVFLRLV